MHNLAIIGASYLQLPIIEKAKAMGYTTHVFAWSAGDVGESAADYFYPISIVEKELILEKCREIGISGICSIASDLAMVTVNYVAEHMGLIGNSLDCTYITTNKHAMREAFLKNGDPTPKSILVESMEDLAGTDLDFPVIVKPIDRSGSRGITKVEKAEDLENAICRAKQQGFLKCALVEEFAAGIEYSVECLSWKGNHTFLAMTRKYTTGAPNFIETGHLQPAPIETDLLERVKGTVFHALDSLKIAYGASHSELKIDADGNIKLIEIGARMGGDLIGSHLVELSTGIDFVKAVIQIAVGEAPNVERRWNRKAGIRFVFSQQDIMVLKKLKESHPQMLLEEDVSYSCNEKVEDSSMRFGYFLFMSDHGEEILAYLPSEI